jgi:molybdate transport system substrate-binding protein
MKVLLFALLIGINIGKADCAEIRVLSGGAARPFVEPATASFKAHAVRIEYGTMGKILKQLAAAGTGVGTGVGNEAAPDMLIITSEALDQLSKEGRISLGRAAPLAKVGIGIAVHEKAPLPDISSPQALRLTLIAARSIAHINPATGSSGKYVVEMFRKLDILEEMKAKTTLVDEGPAVAPVGRGEVELGIHQISEILPVKGAKLVGPLPAAFQKYTVYNAVAMPGTKKKDAVWQYIAHLTSPQAKRRLAAAGYSEP